MIKGFAEKEQKRELSQNQEKKIKGKVILSCNGVQEVSLKPFKHSPNTLQNSMRHMAKTVASDNFASTS